MKTWKKVITAFSVNLLLMLALVVAAVWFTIDWLDTYTHHGQSVEVPAVIGANTDDAVRQIQEAGLNVMIIDSLYVGTPGTVLEQLPEGNLPVKEGRIVYLTVSAVGKQMISMINVTEWSSRQAQSRLEEMGFIVDSLIMVPYEFDDLVLKVTTDKLQSADSGKMFPIHTRLLLHVGSTQLPDEGENTATEEEWFR